MRIDICVSPSIYRVTPVFKIDNRKPLSVSTRDIVVKTHLNAERIFPISWVLSLSVSCALVVENPIRLVDPPVFGCILNYHLAMVRASECFYRLFCSDDVLYVSVCKCVSP